MASTLPPDPYRALGVSKDASLPEIRSAHRKLVLKCHPDKVQDDALKAAKQDEFQKVQQAYELLSDDARRIQYDEQVKLFELRREMGRGNPTPRSNPFEFEVRTAEPRPNTYSRPTPGKPVYGYPSAAPRSHEDLYDEPLRHEPKKRSSYDTTDRRRRDRESEERLKEWRKLEEEEKRREKETKRQAHGEKKKSRDKERRKAADEKSRPRTSAPYVEDDSSDDYQPQPRRSSEKKTSRQRMEEEAYLEAQKLREAEAARAAIKPAPLNEKWEGHFLVAEKYLHTSRRKGVSDDEFRPPSMPRRAETFSAASGAAYVRYATPTHQYSDDDSPRRSSARKESRKSAETPPTRHEKSNRERVHVPDPFINIVEPPSPTARPPPLQSYSSAPPTVPSPFVREIPTRSKTQDYPRHEPIPSLSRSHTFQPDRARERGGSRLRKQVVESGSDSDTPAYDSPRHSPPRNETTYRVQDGRAVPHARHRSEMRDLNDHPRDRTPSPHGTPGRYVERPSLSRNPHSGDRPRAVPVIPSRTHSGYYPVPEPTPIVRTVKPGMTREGSGRVPPYFKEVNYSRSYDHDDVIYAKHAVPNVYDGSRRPSHDRYPDAYRRGQDPVFVT